MSCSNVLHKRPREEVTDESQCHATYVKCVEHASKRSCSSSSLSQGRTFVRFDLSQQAGGDRATSAVDRNLTIDLSTLKILLNTCLVAGAKDVCVGEVAQRACFVVHHPGAGDESVRKVARKTEADVEGESRSPAKRGVWRKVVRKCGQLLARADWKTSSTPQKHEAVDTSDAAGRQTSAPAPTPTVAGGEASDTLVAVARLLSKTGDEGSAARAELRPRVFGKIVVNKVSRKNNAPNEPPDSLCAPLLPGSSVSLHRLFQILDSHNVRDGMLTTSLNRLPYKNDSDHDCPEKGESELQWSTQFTPVQRMHLMLSFS